MDNDKNMALMIQSNSTHLILGGARSGKSGYAEQIAKQSGKEVVYIATAQALDDEMQDRILKHQADRPQHWLSVEEPLALADSIKHHSSADNLILVDCLTLWLMNLMHNQEPLEAAVDELLQVLLSTDSEVVLVSNEISMGVVPMGELSRNYVDNLGRLHQQIAQQVNNVTLMVAGIPMVVKSN